MKNAKGVIAAAAVFIAGRIGFCQTWYGEYKPQLGTLPSEQGWALSNTGGSPDPQIIAGALHQGPTSYNNLQNWHRHDVLMDFDTVSGITFEFKLKVTSSTYGPGGAPDTWRSGFQVLLTDVSKRALILGITSTGIRLSNEGNSANSGSTPLIEIDTTSAYHTYTLTANHADGIRLSIDGTQVATFPLGAPGSASIANDWWFGDGTTAGSCEVSLQSLRWGVVPSPIPTCYANCDGSTTPPVLTANDFQCFLNTFASGCP